MSNASVVQFAADSPPVTWLLPVRDAMPFLPETLRSLAEQAYPRDRQRVLAWDNGSTDGSADVLREWIGEGKPMAGEVVVDRPMGLGASLAAMVQRADTELLARIDGDDRVLPHRLLKQVEFLRRHPRVAAVSGAAELIDAAGNALGFQGVEHTADVDVRWQLRFNNPLIHPGVTMRRSAVLEAGNYQDLKPGQDYDLWIRVAQRHELANLPEPMIAYRVHDRTVTRRGGASVREANRAIQLRNLDALWPGLSQAQWQRLAERMADPHCEDVTLADWRLLGRAAERAAERAGLPTSYFKQARRYRVQSSSLLSRAIKRWPVAGAVWPRAKRLRDRLAVRPITESEASRAA